MGEETKAEAARAESGEEQGVPCPHCGNTVHLRYAAHIPGRQFLTFEIKFEGEYLAAETLGGTITNFSELMKEIAKGIGGKVEVFIASVDYRPHEAAVKFLITDVKGDA